MVKIFKLISGEELIGDLFYGDKNVLCIKPAEIYVVPGKDGEPNQIGIAPYCIYSNNMTIEIEFGQIVWTSEPQPSFLQYYLEKFEKMKPGNNLSDVEGVKKVSRILDEITGDDKAE